MTLSPEELLKLPHQQLTPDILQDSFSSFQAHDWATRFLLSLVPEPEVTEGTLVKAVELAYQHSKMLESEEGTKKIEEWAEELWNKLSLWKEVVGERLNLSIAEGGPRDGTNEEEDDLEDELDLEDPWASGSQGDHNSSFDHEEIVLDTPRPIVSQAENEFLPLRPFLVIPLIQTAEYVASLGHTQSLHKLFSLQESLRTDAAVILLHLPPHLALSPFIHILASQPPSLLLPLFQISRPVSILLDFFSHLVASEVISQDLEELGQELVCLSRMIYERTPEDGDYSEEEWTLQRWHNMSPLEIIRSYFAFTASDVNSIKIDYLRLVYPYLEHLQNSQLRIPTDILMLTYIQSLPITTLESYFQLSRPDLQLEERIITDNHAMCVLALQAVYNKLQPKEIEPEEWEGALRCTAGIMCCLPALPSSRLKTSNINRVLAGDFDSLTEEDIAPLLDLADIHISTSLSFSILCDLSFEPREFLQVWGKGDKQLMWLRKLVHTRLKAVPETKEEVDGWLEVVQGLKEVWGNDKEGGCLEVENINWEVAKAIVGNGSFKIAKLLVEILLDRGRAKTLILETSREYYDNATEGNANRGMMKLAKECLSIVPDSPELAQQRMFIDATSQFFSYISGSAHTLSPLQVRLSKDKIILISHLLSSNRTAYKHPEVLFELLQKLNVVDGAIDEEGEIRTWAMCVEGAVQAGDWTVAEQGCRKMISLAKGEKGRDVAWKGIFALAKMEDYSNFQNRKTLIGHAVLLCPPETISDVLLVLRRIEEQEDELVNDNAESDVVPSFTAAKEMAKASYLGGLLNFSRRPTPAPPVDQPSKGISLDADPGRRGSLDGRFANLFGASSDRDSPDPNSHRGSGLSSRLGNKFERGVGWLIGGDE